MQELIKGLKEVAVPFISFMIVVFLSLFSVIFIILYMSQRSYETERQFCISTYGEDYNGIQHATKVEPKKCLNIKTQETKVFPR